MKYPQIYSITKPHYRYNNGQKHLDKLRGLLQFGPMQPAKTPNPQFLFVFEESDRDNANNLYLALKNGTRQFPGLKRLSGIEISKSTVTPLRIPASSGKDTSRLFSETIEAYLGAGNAKPDLVFIIHSKSADRLLSDPYLACKASCLFHGIPSQYVGNETILNSPTFPFAMQNLALHVLVKLGGIPWSVDIPKSESSLVIGIGTAQIGTSKNSHGRRYMGYAISTHADGIYIGTRFFNPVNDEASFLESLAIGIKECLDKHVVEIRDLNRVSIHVSHLERRSVFERVKDVVQDYRSEERPITVELVRLTTDSSFAVLDLDHAGYVPKEGVVVSLSPKHALLVSEGRQEKAAWRGRRPVTLEMRSEYRSSQWLDFKTIIEEVFWLSSVNWRGFNSKSRPVTLDYAKLLTNLLARMEVNPGRCVEINDASTSLLSIPWFI